ncbi:hypothetical protein D9C73_016164 [Collichthys lucidus]|uniref:Uncharacterized protein n=1 Tax=Collichthys lucidus TaxID=240159 RepID=A0A4U5V6C0_COLLU|nr:hypothetical protein D9C73_016164 [Collichthys lucidus]
MKLSFVFVGLGVSAMLVMIFQTVRQELNLRDLKTRMLENSAQVKRKEEAIAEMKTKIKEIKDKLTTVNIKLDGLRKQKADSDKSAQELDKNLETCNTEKASDT